MNVPRIVDPHRPVPAGVAAACCLLVAGCASPPAGNAPPAIVEECRVEVEQLTDADRMPPIDESMPERPGGETETIDAARVARSELDGSSLASWPEEALLYRCFTSRGVVLTEEQAAVLAEWQQRTETADPDQ